MRKVNKLIVYTDGSNNMIQFELNNKVIKDCGESAGQTIMHTHIHVIPRYDGDMKNPRGSVRHCVEGKGSY